jgi:hypothetical protein
MNFLGPPLPTLASQVEVIERAFEQPEIEAPVEGILNE